MPGGGCALPGLLSLGSTATHSLFPGTSLTAMGLTPRSKSANRSTDDKVWTPWMAARGESRHDVESSRPQADVREVSAVRSTDFPRGRGGLKRGSAAAPPFPVHVPHRLCVCQTSGERNPFSYAELAVLPNGGFALTSLRFTPNTQSPTTRRYNPCCR